MLDIFDLSAGRPAGDLISRVVRVTIGGTEYVLPVRSMKANAEWREKLQVGVTSLLSGLTAEGADVSAVFNALASQMPIMLDLLLSYDTAGVLPSKDEIEAIEPDCSLDVVAACREVWRAANPLVVTAMSGLTDETADSATLPPSNTRPTPTAGSRKRSRKN